jgi:uncharacterized protein YggL (DUF469 family)
MQPMRKRLRKKRRLGEFQELCFDVAFTLPATWTDAEHDAFWEEFIREAIEAQHLSYGGACGAHWNGVASGGRRTPVGEPHRAPGAPPLGDAS